jgi:hypothetical protein
MLLGLHAVYARGRRPVAPLIAEAGMPALGAEAVIGSAGPETAVIAVTSIGVSAAAEIRAPLVAAIAEAALAVVTLVVHVARDTIEITLQMPALAAAQIPIRPERSLLTADGACLALKAARLAACEITLPHALLDAALLHALARVDPALAFGRNGRHGNRAREQGNQYCTHCDASHWYLHFRLVPAAGQSCSAPASGDAPWNQAAGHARPRM